MIGTVLPTAASIASTDRFYKKNEASKERAAKRLLKGLRRKVVGTMFPEVRYYESENVYAIIGRDMKPRWFEIRDGETYFANR